MTLEVLASSSHGNGYILTDTDGRALAIEAGAMPSDYFRNVRPSQFAGVLISHEHKDHARHLSTLLGQYSLRPIATPGTIKALNVPLFLAYPVDTCALIDGWRITPIRVKHDAAEPSAFIIERSGQKILFATDLCEFPDIPHEQLEGLTVVMIEANYCPEIAIRGGGNKTHLDRVSASHLSIQQAERAVKALANGYPVECVVLLHLSHDNSNEAEFKRRIEAVAPAARVYVADKGVIINNLNIW